MPDARRLWRLGPVAVLALAGAAAAVGPAGPEDTLRRYLAATKEGRFAEAYDLCSQAMRQGKSKEDWVKDSSALMAFADVKIFDFQVQPATIAGDVAKVPNVLHSQDRFANTLGLTEYEVYTLVREQGAWRVDSQILIEPPEVSKWFPELAKAPAKPASH